MKLYWAPQTRAQRGIWMLEEAGLDYDMVRVDLGSAERMADADFARASPMGKVPALVDGDIAMAVSAAISSFAGYKSTSLSDKHSCRSSAIF